MKKIILLLISVLLFTGCQAKDEDVTDLQYETYKEYIEKIDTQSDFETEGIDFTIRMIKNVLSDGNYRYDILIDNPQVDMYTIKVLIKLLDDQEYTYPSIGILEDESFSLQPGIVDKKNNVYKGINLSGVSVHDNATAYIYMTYQKTKDKEAKKVERYIKVTADAS